MTHGGKILVDALYAHGARRAYCVAGESYLPVLDAFVDYPDMEIVTCRQESGATFMAEAYGQLTGTPGIALVTRGPGACNAAIGVHAARQSSTPMIFLVGLIASADRDKEAFQEFDLVQMFGSLCKWAAVIDSRERIAHYIALAWHQAISGRPGPVVLGLPEEVVFAKTAPQAVKAIPRAAVHPSAADLAKITERLAVAERPLIIVGDGGWGDQACEDIASFSSATHIPVACAFRRQDIFNHRHANYIGELGTGANPALIKRVKEADLVLVLGSRLDEMTTQSYTLFQEGQTLIHVYPSPEVFGRAYAPDLAIVADVAPTAAALAGAVRTDGRRWAGWRDAARADYTAWTDIAAASPHAWQGADMTQIFRHLRDTLPEDAIVTTDAGNFSGWCQRYLRYGRPGRLCAPVCGAMGYAVPSAVAASLEYPERVVVGFCGDGGFMMTAQELATALHHKAKPIIIVCNNGMYGTIRMHQERDFPGRISATALTNPDFVMLAESYGAFAARVTHADAFPAAFEKARASGKMALIEIVMDPRQISTQAKI